MAETFIRQTNLGETPAGESQSLSFRAFLLGSLLCLLIGVGTIYANAIIQGTFMAWCFSNPVALFLFFYLVLGNILVGTLARNLALRREELVLIYAMMMVSASIPTFGLVEHLLPMITGVFYYATPENNWGELIQPYVPAWIAPSDEQLIQGFYEGLPKGMPVPWEGWLETLGYWSVFLLALYLVSIGLMVLLRRPWMEGERLLYPMMQVPIEMINGREGTSLVSAVFRQPQMWIGFALPVIVGCCNALHNYYPQWPGLYFRSSMYLFRDTINLPFEFSFSLVGFSYFINRNLALGIWFFYLLALVEQGCFNILGVHSTEKLGWFSNPSSPYLTHQALGAMLVFALYTLWKARSHLLAVARRAWSWGGGRWRPERDYVVPGGFVDGTGRIGRHGSVARGHGHPLGGGIALSRGGHADLHRVVAHCRRGWGGAGAGTAHRTRFCHGQHGYLLPRAEGLDWPGLHLSVDCGYRHLPHGCLRQ